MPVAILSGSKNPDDMRRAMDMGAAGFIPKDTSGELMVNAISMILAGGYYIPKTLLQETAPASPGAQAANNLTPRQQQVTVLICEGLTNKQIAAELGIAEATIKMHVTSVFRTFDVTNRTQLASAARDAGLV